MFIFQPFLKQEKTKQKKDMIIHTHLYKITTKNKKLKIRNQISIVYNIQIECKYIYIYYTN